MSVCYIELKIDLPFSRNLKDKRAVMKSVTSKISKNFNVSISEIDFNDVWKTAKIGIAMVASNGKIFDPMISTLLEFIERNYPDIQISIISKELI